MRNNQPVSQREHDFSSEATLMSTTDTEGRITYANAAFVEVSGYALEEIVGAHHNLVRHPDMPPAAFADMWASLKSGESWTGIVKNRRKNGDHYWVRANANPVMRNGKAVGYMSVRTKPTRAEVAAAEALYAELRESQGRRRLHRGVVVHAGAMAARSWLQTMPVRWRLRLPTGAAQIAQGLGIVEPVDAVPGREIIIGRDGQVPLAVPRHGPHLRYRQHPPRSQATGFRGSGRGRSRGWRR